VVAVVSENKSLLILIDCGAAGIVVTSKTKSIPFELCRCRSNRNYSNL